MVIPMMMVIIFMMSSVSLDVVQAQMVVVSNRVDENALPSIKSTTHQLRHNHHLPRDNEHQHRRLEVFAIPFRLQWRIEVGNGFPQDDREPTAEEYEGVRQATEDWLNSAIATHYVEDTTDFTFLQASCDLVQEGTSWSSIQPEDTYPHKIQLECLANFDADNVEDLPTNIEFILDINTDYDFEEFTRTYLWNAAPPTNLFRYSERVGYTLTDTGPTAPGEPSLASSSAPAPMTAPVAAAPGTAAPSDTTTTGSVAAPVPTPYQRLYQYQHL